MMKITKPENWLNLQLWNILNVTIIENVDTRLLIMKYLISMILVTWLLNTMCPEN